MRNSNVKSLLVAQHQKSEFFRFFFIENYIGGPVGNRGF